MGGRGETDRETRREKVEARNKKEKEEQKKKKKKRRNGR